MIPVICKCGKSLKVKPEMAGKKVRCPACREIIQVSQGDKASGSPSPQADTPSPPPQPETPKPFQINLDDIDEPSQDSSTHIVIPREPVIRLHDEASAPLPHEYPIEESEEFFPQATPNWTNSGPIIRPLAKRKALQSIALYFRIFGWLLMLTAVCDFLFACNLFVNALAQDVPILTLLIAMAPFLGSAIAICLTAVFVFAVVELIYVIVDMEYRMYEISCHISHVEVEE